MKKFDHNRFLIAVSYLIDNDFVKNKRELSSIFNISASKFSEILNKRMNPGFDLYEILVSNFNISSSWLLTGQGNMLNTEKTKSEENVTLSKGNKKGNKNSNKRNVQKMLPFKVSEPSPPYNSQIEIIQLLKENKKLVEKHNTMLEKEVCRLTERNEFLEGENKRLSAENKGLREEIRKVKATKKMPTKKESKPEEV